MAQRVSNPPNPWASSWVEWLEEPPRAKLEVYEERAKSILSKNDSPDLPFRWSLNPYRGCQHGCAYCYARPSHQYLSFGAGTDFERKLVVKTNAHELLRRELSRRSWRGEAVVLSGNTDCYQPLEASYELTRRCLEVLRDHSNPVAVITKGALIRRDVQLLAELHQRAGARIFVSIGCVDDRMARAIEPSVSAPSKRFEAMRALADAGVPVGVSLSPLIPGLNEDQVPAVLERAKQAGATSAFLTLLRLPAEVRAVFEERIRANLPLRAERILSGIRQMRGGRSNEHAFGERMRGRGERWKAVASLFEIQCRRLGLATGGGGEPERWRTTARRRPRQGTLFGPEPPVR